jgi:hypothetical protein
MRPIAAAWPVACGIFMLAFNSTFLGASRRQRELSIGSSHLHPAHQSWYQQAAQVGGVPALKEFVKPTVGFIRLPGWDVLAGAGIVICIWLAGRSSRRQLWLGSGQAIRPTQSPPSGLGPNPGTEGSSAASMQPPSVSWAQGTSLIFPDLQDSTAAHGLGCSVPVVGRPCLKSAMPTKHMLTGLSCFGGRPRSR